MDKFTIVTCAQCKPHEYQDRRYGDKKRAANLMNQQNERAATFIPKYRCTVCGAVHTK